MDIKKLFARNSKLTGTALLIVSMTTAAMAADVNMTVVTPARTAQSIADVPASVDVIMPEQIAAAPGDTLDQKLQNLVPGIVASRSAGLYSQSGTLSMRGFSAVQDSGARVLVMLDGVPLNSSATGGVIWNDLIFQDIERIEVVKGAGSSIYGANAMAGVINIITKNKKGFELTSSYGTYNTVRTGAKAGFGITDKLFLELSANALRSDGYVSTIISTEKPAKVAAGSYHKSSIDMRQAGAKTTYRLGENNTVGITYSYSERKNGEEYQKDGFDEPDYRQNNTHLVSAKWNGKSDNGLSWDIGANYKNVHYEKFETDKNHLAKAERQDYGLNVSFSKNYDTFMLTAGVDASNGAVFGKDYTYTTMDHYGDDNGQMYIAAPYLQAQKKLMDNKLGLTASLRYDYAGFYDGYSRNANGGVPAEYTTGKKLDDKNWEEFSPKIAVSYKYAESISQYVSWGHGFNAPSLENMTLSMKRGGKQQVANPELKPETSDTVETGFTFNPIDGLYIEPSAYYTKAKDYVYASYPDATLRIYKNLGEVQIYGTEIPVKYQLGDLGLTASYAQSHSKVLSGKEESTDLKGKEVGQAPRHIWSAGLSYMFPHQTLFSVNWAHKRREWNDTANTASYGGYSITSVSLTSQINKNVKIGLSADNIFNERYTDGYDSKSNAYTTLAPGRTITGSLTMSF